ncbi:MAG: DUF2130 domain-containing protein [Treponema sp.]|nr:DUF2130 domain-containing protein [Treponema sp.]
MEKTNNIICPFCHKEFKLTDAITAQIENELRDNFQKEIEIIKADKTAALESQREELEKKISQRYEKHFEKLLEEESIKMRETANEKAKRELNAELNEKQEEIEEAYKKLDVYRKKETQLIKKERLLEEQKHDLEIEYQEKLTREYKKAYAVAQEKINEEYELKIKEKEKIIDDLNKQMKEGQRKAEQGSMKLQGEILELELEELLKDYFPNDEIIPIAPGKKGGDILQIVKLASGKAAGNILWETKRTKNWQSAWIQKLKDDQRNANAELAVIASEVIPPEIKNFGIENGVWITELKFALGLSTVLRENLKNAAAIRIANSGKDDKAEMVFNYLTGTQFKQRVESILEAYVEMNNDIETEKRIMEKSWARREKQVERFVRNLSGMCGDLQGIGASLPDIKLLSLQP